MADIDEIMVCPECLHPVDRLVMCPVCCKPVERMPSLLLPTLRTLKAKGWVVTGWKRGNSMDEYIALNFFRFAPPVEDSWMTHRVSGGIFFELFNLNPQVFSYEGDQKLNPCKTLYEWASRAPCFAIPFGQDFCDECRQQGGNWHFSQCKCPEHKSFGSGLLKFADGLPERCRYADAQIVTLESRFKQLESFFTKNPITKRKAGRQLSKQS